jgi:hypothetical protein
MLFKRESEMASPVRNWLYRQDLQIKQEFAVPWGVCDFVGVSFRAHHVLKRLVCGQHKSIGPLRRVEVLRHIPEKDSGESISFHQLLEVCGPVDAESLQSDLKNLLASRFISRSRTNGFQKINGWVPLHKRIVAVELKLHRISEALGQASSNKAFATESYVAFPSDLARRLFVGDRKDEFVAAGVGILEVQSDTCRVRLRPDSRSVNSDDSLRAHCVERFWRTRGSSSLIAERRAQAYGQ